VSEEQFRIWAREKGLRAPLAVKGHTFAFEREYLFKVDGGVFEYEEALELVKSLNSSNPSDHFNAVVTIWERNGVLRLLGLSLIGILVVALIALV
jgi:hypothetical protein